MIGYLAAGILIGPHGFGFISDAEGAQTLAEFGVVFLLFTIGLELSFERLKQLRTYVFGLGTAQVALTGAIIFGTALAFGISINAAIVIGGGPRPVVDRVRPATADRARRAGHTLRHHVFPPSCCSRI